LQFANEAPVVMQLFHSHGISCDRIETEALKLSSHEPSNQSKDEPLKLYNDMLESLGRFSITFFNKSIAEPNKHNRSVAEGSKES
jgi:hypothetical protein